MTILPEVKQHSGMVKTIPCVQMMNFIVISQGGRKTYRCRERRPRRSADAVGSNNNTKQLKQ